MSKQLAELHMFSIKLLHLCVYHNVFAREEREEEREGDRKGERESRARRLGHLSPRAISVRHL